MKKNENIKSILFLAATLGSTVAILSDCAILPATDGLYTAAASNVALANYIVSGPALLAIVMALLGQPVIRRIGKKKSLILSFIISSVTHLLCGYTSSLIAIAVLRSITGLAVGMVQLTAVLLIDTYYQENEEKRGFALGLLNVGNGVSGTVMGIVCGYLAANVWNDCFKFFWICVPLAVLMLFWIPEFKETSEDDSENNHSQKFQFSKVFPLFISFTVICITYCVIYYLIGVYIAERSFGNEIITGYVSALGTIASSVVCIFFGKIYVKMQRWTIVPAFAFLSIGYLIMYGTNSLVIATVAFLVMGAAYGGIAYSYYFMRASVVVPEKYVPLATGIVMAANGIALFLSTYFATCLMNLLHTEKLSDTFPILAVICLVFFIVEFLMARKETSEEAVNGK